MTKMCKMQKKAAAPTTAQTSSAPQPGAYHCTNGFILTISKCDKLSGVNACWFKVVAPLYVAVACLPISWRDHWSASPISYFQSRP